MTVAELLPDFRAMLDRAIDLAEEDIV